MAGLRGHVESVSGEQRHLGSPVLHLIHRALAGSLVGLPAEWSRRRDRDIATLGDGLFMMAIVEALGGGCYASRRAREKRR